MTSVVGSESVSTAERYNLIGPADAEAAAVAAAEYPGLISYCNRNHSLVEDEKSWSWDSTAALEGHKSWTSKWEGTMTAILIIALYIRSWRFSHVSPPYTGYYQMIITNAFSFTSNSNSTWRSEYEFLPNSSPIPDRNEVAWIGGDC